MGFAELRPADNPKPFKKGDNGRKGRKYVPESLKAFNEIFRHTSVRMKPSAVKTSLEYLLGMPIPRLREIAGDPNDKHNKYPALIRLAAVAILRDGFPAVLGILRQIHGQSAYLKVETSTRVEFLHFDESAVAQLHETLEQIAAQSSQVANGEADSDLIEEISIE